MSIKRAFFVFLLGFLVACMPLGLQATPNATVDISPTETPETGIPATPSAPTMNLTSETDDQVTSNPTIQPTPFLRVDSQLKLLPAGFYPVYYDHALKSLVALSFQLTHTIIASGNQAFQYSNNVKFAEAGTSLVNLQSSSKFDLPEMDQLNCDVTSISVAGTSLVFQCGDDGVYLYQVGENLERLFSDQYRIEQPLISPDDEQLAFCLINPTDTYNPGLYRVQLDECVINENCKFTYVASQCEGELFSWSPDGKKIVVSNEEGGFQEFEFVFGGRTEYPGPSQDEDLIKLIWSPDGRWITFSTTKSDGKNISSSLYLMNVLVKEPRLFFETDHQIELVGWLNILSPFKMGKNYVVLPSENQYWLKDSPNEESFNLKLLVDGEKVRVLEEFEVVDGEKWWQVRVGDFKGWVKEDSNRFSDDWMFGLKSPVFETGSRLIVKLSGNDIRLREMPSLNGKIKRYLQPGMELKILDGPATVDRYNWWLVEIEGSKIYGWVVEEALWYASD